MKIVYLFRSIAVKGGVEKILVNKMNYLADLPGYEVFLLTYEQAGHPISYPLSSKVTYIDMDIPFYRKYQYGFIRRQWMQMKMKKKFCKCLPQEIAAIDPDIVICTSYTPLELSVLTRMNHRAKKIVESHSAKLAIGQMAKHPRKGIPRLLATITDEKFYRNIRKCDAFVTLTKADALSWKPIIKAQVIPNMLAHYPKEIQQGESKKQVISAGRLTYEKGYERLIEAWKTVHKRHPDWILSIYGGEGSDNSLPQRIKNAGLENSITIFPPTPHIYEKYMESDMYVMSSRWEGFPLVLLEAMSCGIPCVSFDCSHGPSDIIRDGEDGLLVENGNIEQLAEKICYLIEHDEIRREMGRKGRESIKQYLPENVMAQWEKLFNDLTTTL